MSPASHPDQGPLAIVNFTLGPVQTNSYLVADTNTGSAAVIDPADDGALIAREAEKKGWKIEYVLMTHAHFDHTAGVAGVIQAVPSPVTVGLNQADLEVWQAKGGAALFGLGDFDPGPKPSLDLSHGLSLKLGEQVLEARHTPGHSPGHVILVSHEAKLVFCGDLIFYSGVGRTDLPGGSWDILLESIEKEVLSLPDETKLLPGHGPATTVARERRMNPFLSGSYI